MLSFYGRDTKTILDMEGAELEQDIPEYESMKISREFLLRVFVLMTIRNTQRIMRRPYSLTFFLQRIKTKNTISQEESIIWSWTSQTIQAEGGMMQLTL